MAFLSDRQEVNFLNMVSPEPNTGCWIWTGYVTKEGYGRVNVNNKAQCAHRVSYRQYRGDIPTGYLILHSCDQSLCVNPQHLRVGTDAENAADKVKRKRVPRKITDEQVIQIRKSPGRYKDIAAFFNISAAWVSRIKSGEARTYAREKS